MRSNCEEKVINLVIDPQLIWNKELADQLTEKKIPKVVNSLLKFCATYSIQGLVISFDKHAVLDDSKTFAVFKQLRTSFEHFGLRLIGYFENQVDFSYVRPVVFE